MLDVLGDRDIPMLSGVEIGHAGANLPMAPGLLVDLDVQQRSLALLEPAVRAPSWWPDDRNVEQRDAPKR